MSDDELLALLGTLNPSRIVAQAATLALNLLLLAGLGAPDFSAGRTPAPMPRVSPSNRTVAITWYAPQFLARCACRQRNCMASNRWTGTLDLRVTSARTGRVRAITVATSSGDARTDAKALAWATRLQSDTRDFDQPLAESEPRAQSIYRLRYCELERGRTEFDLASW